MARLKKVYKFSMFIGLIAILVIAFGAIIISDYQAKISANENEDSIVTPYVNQEAELVINTFLNLLVEGKVETAKEYAVGDTKQLLNANSGVEVPKGVLLDSQITYNFANENIIEAIVTAYVQIDRQKDIGQYVYSLIYQDNQWKIFNIETLSITLGKDNAVEKEESVALDVIMKYLQHIEKGEWEESIFYLAGDTKISSQQSLPYLPNLTSKITIKETKPLILQENNEMYFVRYLVENELQRQEMNMVFEVQNIAGDWKVTKLSSVNP